MKFRNLAAIATFTAGALYLQSPRVCAQDDGPPPPPPPEAAAPPDAPAAPAKPAAAAPAAPAAPDAAPGGPRGNGGPPNADRMEQFRQRMNDRIKTALKATDEEWSVIQPLLDKVQEKMRDTMIGRFGGGPRPQRGGGDRPGGGGNPDAARPERAGGGDRPDRPGSAESQALRTSLESDATSNTEIKAKLQALRDARKKSEADLEQARADLKGVLNLRQEATLVMMGMLD